MKRPMTKPASKAAGGKRMTDQKRCVECRYCELRVDEKDGTRDYCTLKKILLPLNVCARMACDQIELPEATGYWGP
jgi:hypothetical protein